jgi:hypothetical protein
LQHAEVSGRGNDADDGEGGAIQPDCAADRRSVACEQLVPQAIADHHDAGSARAVLFGAERTPGDRSHAKNLEELGRRRERGQPPGVAMIRHQIQIHRHERANPIDQPAPLPIVEEVRDRGRFARGAGIAIRLPHHHEPFRVGKRHGPEQHGPNDAEDRRRHADAEREREQRRSREARRAAKEPKGVGGVPGEIGREPHPIRRRSGGRDGAQPVGAPDGARELRAVAQFERDSIVRLLLGGAGRAVLVEAGREVLCELFDNVGVARGIASDLLQLLTDVGAPVHRRPHECVMAATRSRARMNSFHKPRCRLRTSRPAEVSL